MKARLFILAVCLLAGCISSTPEKFDAQVSKWAPVGTPLADARRNMERKGFECQLLSKENRFNPYGTECLECERFAAWSHTWVARIFIVDGKVSGYGPNVIE